MKRLADDDDEDNDKDDWKLKQTELNSATCV